MYTSQKKKVIPFFLLVSIPLFTLSPPALAGEYLVGPGQVYSELEALRTAGIAWQDGDRITLTASDASLTAPLNFGSATVSVGGGFSVMPKFFGSHQFAISSGSISLNSVNLSGFSSNSPGGVVNSATAAITGGINIFSLNNTNNNGGAIYGRDIYITGGLNSFFSNEAVNSGGAIYADNVYITGGSNGFTGNSALSGGFGGAIYVRKNASLFAQDGDLLVKSNALTIGNSAIYLENSDGNNTFALGASAGRYIRIYDRMAVASNPGLQVAINPEAGQTGTVLLDTSLASLKLHTIYADTTIYNGTMKLAGNANYTSNMPGGIFAVNSGATLAAGGSGNNIIVSTAKFDSGSTLSFDLTGATPVNILTVNSPNFLDVSNTVDILAFPGAAGSYNLATTTSGSFNLPIKNLTTRGEAVSATRAASAQLGTPNAGRTMTLLTGKPASGGIVTWTGAGGNIWNASATNWDTTTVDGNVSEKFLHGDAVVFRGVGQAVTAQDKGVQVAAHDANPGIQIQSGDWIFGGGAIEGGGLQFTGNGSVTFDNMNTGGQRYIWQYITVDSGATAGLSAANSATAFFSPNSSSGSLVTVNGGSLNLGTPSSTGTLLFMNNQSFTDPAVTATTGSTITFTGGNNIFAANMSEDGGAIYNEGDTNITGGNNSFIGNNANSAGGAIYNAGIVNISGGVNSFTGNFAGLDGGAVYSGTAVNVSDGSNTFIGNSASTSGAIASSGTIDISGGVNTFTANNSQNPGGAISARSNVAIAGGLNSFNGNSSDSDGGAIASFSTVNITDGQNYFSGNNAVSGGAVFSLDNVNITGGANTFTGNAAQFLGGAIYSAGGATLVAQDSDMTFSGNIASGEPNAIYVSNSTNASSLNLAAASGKTISFFDPIASNGTKTNLTVDINNSAGYTGTMLFDKYTSNVYGNTTVHNGTMQLTNSAVYGGANNIGSFTLNSGAVLAVTPGLTPSFIKADNISIDGKSGLAPFTYGPELTPGRRTVLTLEGTTVSRQENYTQTNGVISIGAFDYNYSDLHWEGNNLVVGLDASVINPERGGIYSAEAPLRLMLDNPLKRIVFQRQSGMFELPASPPVGTATRRPQTETINYFADASATPAPSHLWAVPFAVHTNIDGNGSYDSGKVNNSGFALGYDTKISANAFLGGAIGVAGPDYSRGGTDADASDVRLALYGGSRIDTFRLGWFLGYGWADIAQRRDVLGERYNASYNARPFSAAFKLSRPYEGKNSTLEPFISYEYLAVKSDGYAENPGQYSLALAGHTEELSRLAAGLTFEKRSNSNTTRASIFYLGQFGSRTPETTAFFTADPATPFSSAGTPLDRGSLGLSLGSQWQLSKNTELGFNYTGLFGARSNSQSFDLNFIYKF